MEELKFEQALEKLEKIVQKLEAAEVTLEESLKLFEDGVGLARVCNQHLDKAEKQVEVLLQKNSDLEDGSLSVLSKEDEQG